MSDPKKIDKHYDDSYYYNKSEKKDYGKKTVWDIEENYSTYDNPRLAAINLYLANKKESSIENDDVIIWDYLVNKMNNNIHYDMNTGIFTFCVDGYYLVNYSITVLSSSVGTNYAFAFGGKTYPIIYATGSPCSSGTSIQGLVKAKRGDTAKCYYIGEKGVVNILSDLPVQGNIIISYYGPLNKSDY